MTTLDTVLLGVEGGQTKLTALDKPIAAFDAHGERGAGGQARLVRLERDARLHGAVDVSPTRGFIEVKPVLDYESLMPGETATTAIRKASPANSD